MENEVLMSSYECLGCGSILKTEGDPLLKSCSCGANKWHKIAGDFKTMEEGEFFDIQKEVLQDIITRREEHATERICTYIKEKHKLYTTRDDIKSEIWVYDSGIYKPNGESHIKEIVRKFLEETYTPQRANKVIAKIEADTMIDTDVFFNTMYLDEICVKNGILNLKTRELSEFTPEKIFFNKLPIEFKPEAKCPSVDQFFRDILKDPSDKSVLYELTGFCLHKEYFAEKAFMFLGSGRNGKGKTLSLLKNFLGTENTCSVRLAQMDSNSSALCELHNRLVNLAGDLSDTSLRDTGIFKELTGRDTVQVKRKYLRDLIFTNYAKMIFACNKLPRVYDLSQGFWSRWILLEFPYEFLPQEEIDKRENKEYLKLQDPEIIKKITTPEELSGLLNEALDGLDRLKKNKDFSYSKGTAAVKDFWIRNSDSFTAFCLDNLEEDYEGFVVKKRLRSEFVKYCKKHKVKGTSDKNMKVVLEDLFGAVEGRKNIDMNQEAVWEGIKLKESKESNGFLESIGNSNSKVSGKTLPFLTNSKKQEELSSVLLDSLKILSKSKKLIKISELEKLPLEELSQSIDKLKENGMIHEPKEGFVELL